MFSDFFTNNLIIIDIVCIFYCILNCSLLSHIYRGLIYKEDNYVKEICWILMSLLYEDIVFKKFWTQNKSQFSNAKEAYN
jgi:hypothetical protein